MKTWFRFAASMVFACICCQSCEKCAPVHQEIPPDLADWFFYPEGSWWAYENDKNNRIDTLWFRNDRSSVVEGNSYEDVCLLGYHATAYYYTSQFADSASLNSFHVRCSCGEKNEPACRAGFSVGMKNGAVDYHDYLDNDDNNFSDLQYVYFNYDTEENRFYSAYYQDRISASYYDVYGQYRGALVVHDKVRFHPFIFTQGVGLSSFGIQDTLFTLKAYSLGG